MSCLGAAPSALTCGGEWGAGLGEPGPGDRKRLPMRDFSASEEIRRLLAGVLRASRTVGCWAASLPSAGAMTLPPPHPAKGTMTRNVSRRCQPWGRAVGIVGKLAPLSVRKSRDRVPQGSAISDSGRAAEPPGGPVGTRPPRCRAPGLRGPDACVWGGAGGSARPSSSQARRCCPCSHQTRRFQDVTAEHATPRGRRRGRESRPLSQTQRRRGAFRSHTGEACEDQACPPSGGGNLATEPGRRWTSSWRLESETRATRCEGT